MIITVSQQLSLGCCFSHLSPRPFKNQPQSLPLDLEFGEQTGNGRNFQSFKSLERTLTDRNEFLPSPCIIIIRH
jgi:hypothetical protein